LYHHVIWYIYRDIYAVLALWCARKISQANARKILLSNSKQNYIRLFYANDRASPYRCDTKARILTTKVETMHYLHGTIDQLRIFCRDKLIETNYMPLSV